MELSKAETSRAILKNKTSNERKAAIIRAELELYYQKEFELLMRLNKNIHEKELEQAFENANFLLLFLEYVRLQETILFEKKRKKNVITKFINIFASLIGDLNLFSMIGTFTANILGLIGVINAALLTTLEFVGAMTVLAFTLPIALSSMIMGVGIELVNAVIHPKTPNRSAIIGFDLVILGFASTALMIPFKLFPAVFLGFPVVLPLLFSGIAAASYCKDLKRLEHNENLISINNRIIEKKEYLLNKYLKNLTEENQIINIENPIIQRLTFELAEAKRSNANLKIQHQTLSKMLTMHNISILAMTVLVVSAFIFPPLTFGAAIGSVVGIGIFLGVSLYGKKLRDDEKKLLTENENKNVLSIGAIQASEFNNAITKVSKALPKLAKETTKEDKFQPGKLFKNNYMQSKTASFVNNVGVQSSINNETTHYINRP